LYNNFQLAKKYLHYYRTAFNGKGHGMHSPFVFDFILNVLNNKSEYLPPDSIEQTRKKLLSNTRTIEIEDLGAGSRSKASNKRTVAQLAKTSLKPEKYAQLLYRLVKHYEPETIIELGTSLGITTSYLALANPRAKVYTVEGSQSVSAIADANFHELKIKNIKLFHGNFDNVLPVILKDISYFSLAYIDGNHRYTPTINYFHQLLAKSTNDTILIFDDIHWSEEMEEAWEEIKSHPAVQYTIDIFFLGFVFFKKEFKVKQHFSIRF
jgi:predicted O-methyltransferase YrrM